MTAAAGVFLGARWVPLFLAVAVSTYLLHRKPLRTSHRPLRRRVNLAERHGPAWVETCAYCLGRAETFDHVVPFSKGGSDERWNMAPACRRCNSSKGARSPEDWWNDIGRGQPYPEYWPRSVACQR